MEDIASVRPVAQVTRTRSGLGRPGQGRGLGEAPGPFVQRHETSVPVSRFAIAALARHDQTLRHPRIRGERHPGAVRRDTHHREPGVPLSEHAPEALPGVAARRRQGQDQGDHAPGPQFPVGQVGERRSDPGVAVVGISPRKSAHAFRHVPLVRLAGIEGGEGRCRRSRCRPLPGHIAGERRVHDDEIEAAVADLRRDRRRGLLPGAAGSKRRVARVEERPQFGSAQQFQGTELHFPIRLPAVGKRVEAGKIETLRGREAGERGTRDVDRRGHDIAAVEDLLHQGPMEFRGGAAGPLVARRDFLVSRGEQRTGAAGEVTHPESADPPGIRPVHLVQQGNRQAGEQGGRGRERVEGRQVLPVGDQPLEDAAGQVVGVRHAQRFHLVRHLEQALQHPTRGAGRNMVQDVPRDGEDGPVVEFEDPRPLLANRLLQIHRVPADQARRRDSVGDPGQAVVENDGVRQDRAGHPARLFDIGHPEEPRDARHDSRHILECPRRLFDSLLHQVGRPVESAARDGRDANQVRQFFDRALEPTRLGEPRPGGVEDGESETGFPKGGFEFVLVLQRRRIPNRDRGFDGARLSGDLEIEPGPRFLLDGPRRFVLRLDDHRGASRIGDEEIRTPAAPGQEPGVFRPDHAPGQHPPKERAERVVRVGFDLPDHGGDALRGGFCVNGFVRGSQTDDSPTIRRGAGGRAPPPRRRGRRERSRAAAFRGRASSCPGREATVKVTDE